MVISWGNHDRSRRDVTGMTISAISSLVANYKSDRSRILSSWEYIMYIYIYTGCTVYSISIEVSMYRYRMYNQYQ